MVSQTQLYSCEIQYRLGTQIKESGIKINFQVAHVIIQLYTEQTHFVDITFRKTDYVVSMYLPPPHKIHPPHQIIQFFYITGDLLFLKTCTQIM